jgi:coenzyme F420-reducing hydrogenase delta subunit/predicted transcriptional regulator
MCSGRVDLAFIFRAFAKGVDGVLVGGCRLGECNYITHGNFDALSNYYIGQRLMAYIGLDPQRLRIEFMSGADGGLLAEVCDDFADQIKAIGPIGLSEEISPQQLNIKLAAVEKLVPYIRLVERERLRPPVKTEEAYLTYFASDEIQRLIDDIIIGPLAMSEITTLLRENPRSTAEIAEVLGRNPSEVSRYLKSSSRFGLVRYDTHQNHYALA